MQNQNMRAKKSLGQNFLKSKAALSAIISAADIKPEEIVLEAGPGKGALTTSLLQKARKVIAVEKDDRMIPFLTEIFQKEIAQKKLEIVHGDILEFDLESKIPSSQSYKIVANIPYYITGQFIRKFLTEKNRPEKMVLMLQKEVAKRIVAADKKESILSLSVKMYGQPKYISTVKAKDFSPAPKVDSAIILIQSLPTEKDQSPGKNHSRENETNEKEKILGLIKKGFQHKRKMLAQNIGIPTEKRVGIFAQINTNEKIRAEDLSLEQWKKLYQILMEEKIVEKII